MRTVYSVKNSITQFISNIVMLVTLFIAQSMFIRILGIEYNGLNGLFTNILTILNLFELGIGSSITYNLYKYIKNNDKETITLIMNYYKKAYYCIAILIFIIGLLIVPFLKYITKDVTIDINLYIVYILSLLGTVSSYLLSYKRNLLYANQRNYIINIIDVIYVIVLNILQILIIYITKNYYLYLIIKIVCVILENIIISIKVNKDYPYILDKNVKELDKDIKESIISRVKALMIHKTSGAVTNGTDNIIISTFLGITTVGLYTNYYYIINSVKKIFLGIINSTGASVGNLLVENNKDKNYTTYKKIRFLNYWIATFTSVSLLLLTEPFISIWIGSEYILDTTVLIVLVINYFQAMMKTTYHTFREAAGIWIEDKYVPIIQILINIVSSIILLKLIGLAGIFLGTIISSLAMWIYSYPKFLYTKLFNKKVIDYFKEILRSIFIFSLIIIASYIIANSITINNVFIKLLINSLISIIIPNIIMYLLFRKTTEYKYYKELIKKGINKSKK